MGLLCVYYKYSVVIIHVLCMDFNNKSQCPQGTYTLNFERNEREGDEVMVGIIEEQHFSYM